MALPRRGSMWYIARVNRDSKEKSKRWGRRHGCEWFIHFDKATRRSRIMSIRQWLWTLVLAVIVRRVTSDSIIIVEDECSRKFREKKIISAESALNFLLLYSVLQKTAVRQEELGPARQTRRRVRKYRELPSCLRLWEIFHLRGF